MSLEKSILSGKERRAQYRGSKASDQACRNHGACPWCLRNRTVNLRRLAATAALAALAGCSTLPSKTVTVNVPVPVQCKVPKPAKPAYPTDSLSLGQDVFTQNKALRAEIEIRGGYELELETALDACTNPLK